MYIYSECVEQSDGNERSDEAEVLAWKHGSVFERVRANNSQYVQLNTYIVNRE